MSFKGIIRAGETEKMAVKPFSLPPVASGTQDLLSGDGGNPLSGGSEESRLMDLERQAYAEGYAAGERAGLEMGRKKAETLVRRISGILEDLERFHRRLYASAERDLVDLALAIAGRILHQEVTLRPEAVVAVAREAIRRAVERSRIRVRVHPDDLEILQAHKEKLLEQVEGIKHLTLEADKSVGIGGCVVETPYGDVDARLDQQLEEVARALRALADGRRAQRPASGEEA